MRNHSNRYDRSNKFNEKEEVKRQVVYLVLTIFLPDCRQIRVRTVTTKAMEILHANRQIRGLVECVMLQCGILLQKTETISQIYKNKNYYLMVCMICFILAAYPWFG